SEAFDGTERGVQTRTTERVVDNIEALSVCVHRNDFVKTRRGQIDRHSAIAPYHVRLRWTHGAIHRRADGTRDLYGHSGNTATTQHQEVLARTQTDAIDEPLPCRNENQG